MLFSYSIHRVFHLTRSSAAAAACLGEDFAHFVRSGPFHRFLRSANAELVSCGPFPYSFEGTRYQKQASPVRERYSVHENPLLWYAMRFQKHSVRKTGFYGTEQIFGTENALLRYDPPTVRNETTGHDYCVAGSGWKMRPLPTTRRTTTP